FGMLTLVQIIFPNYFTGWPNSVNFWVDILTPGTIWPIYFVSVCSSAPTNQEEVLMTMVDVFGKQAFDVPKVFAEERIQVRPYSRRPATKRRPKALVVEQPQDPVVTAMQGVAELYDALKGGSAKRAAAEWKMQRKQEGKTKRTAFVLFYLMSALLVGMLWAGTHG